MVTATMAKPRSLGQQPAAKNRASRSSAAVPRAMVARPSSYYPLPPVPVDRRYSSDSATTDKRSYALPAWNWPRTRWGPVVSIPRAHKILPPFHWPYFRQSSEWSHSRPSEERDRSACSPTRAGRSLLSCWNCQEADRSNQWLVSPVPGQAIRSARLSAVEPVPAALGWRAGMKAELR